MKLKRTSTTTERTILPRSSFFVFLSVSIKNLSLSDSFIETNLTGLGGNHGSCVGGRGGHLCSSCGCV